MGRIINQRRDYARRTLSMSHCPGEGLGTAWVHPSCRCDKHYQSLRDQMKLEKAYFHECQESKDAQCSSIPALVQKLKEIGQNRGKALLGHLNISINLMIKPAPGKWTGPLEAITMRHGDCKSYSLAKYAGAQELGISADKVRLVIVTIADTVRIIWSPRCIKTANGSFSIT